MRGREEGKGERGGTVGVEAVLGFFEIARVGEGVGDSGGGGVDERPGVVHWVCETLRAEERGGRISQLGKGVNGRRGCLL